MKVQLPLTKDVVEGLKIGDVLELTGYIYTARDAAHKRMVETLEQGGALPFDANNQIIYYAGPCPAAPGRVIGPIGPTTSYRMDPYVEPLLKKGVIAMIGKGDRSSYIPSLLQKHNAVYLISIGGAAAISALQVKKAEEIAYQDLGTESIKKLYVEGLKVIVAIDTQGNVLHDKGVAQYEIKE